MVFHWSLSDCKSPQVSRILLSILAVLNNAVVWMVSTRLPTSKFSSPFSNPLATVPNAPITIGIIVTSMFHSFFHFLSKVEVLILLFTFFLFYSVVSRDSKVNNFANSLFFFLLIIFGLAFWPRLGDLPSLWLLLLLLLFYSFRVFHISVNWWFFTGVIIIIIINIIIIIIYSFRVSHISIGWWLFTRVWETESLLKSPWLFSVSSLEMDTTIRVQILDKADCISHSTNTRGKVMNSIILLPAMGK